MIRTATISTIAAMALASVAGAAGSSTGSGSCTWKPHAGYSAVFHSRLFCSIVRTHPGMYGIPSVRPGDLHGAKAALQCVYRKRGGSVLGRVYGPTARYCAARYWKASYWRLIVPPRPDPSWISEAKATAMFAAKAPGHPWFKGNASCQLLTFEAPFHGLQPKFPGPRNGLGQFFACDVSGPDPVNGGDWKTTRSGALVPVHWKAASAYYYPTDGELSWISADEASFIFWEKEHDAGIPVSWASCEITPPGSVRYFDYRGLTTGQGFHCDSDTDSWNAPWVSSYWITTPTGDLACVTYRPGTTLPSNTSCP